MPDPLDNRRAPRHRIVLAGFCALATLAVMAADFRGPALLSSPLSAGENFVQDFFARHGRFTPANTNLVLVGIDQPAYTSFFSDADLKREPVLRDMQANYPWSRAVWARLIEKLSDAGAKAVAVDVLFAAEREGDDELRAALDTYSNRVVVVSAFDLEATDRGVPAHFTLPNTDLIPETSGHPVALDPRVGFANIWPDGDGVFRRTRFRITNHELGDVVDANPDAVVESFPARALEKLGAAEKIPPAGTQPVIRFTGPPGTWPVIPIGDVLAPEIWERNFSGGKYFADKFVLIGPTAIIFQDLHQTPFHAAMTGPEVHLQIINAALHGEFLRETPPLASGLMIALAGLLAAALCLLMRAPVQRLLVITAAGVAFFFGAEFLFNQANLIVPIVSPLLVLGITGIGALGYDFAVERLERMKLRHTMGLYFSPRVLEAVLADPGSMKPRRADVTLLLTDLRNSTPLAERLGPQGLFDLLNRVFEAQTSAIMGEDGNLEHFLGDQFLSYWGAPQSQPDAADRAQRAAMKLIRAMEDLRVTLPPEVQKLFGYGVALHSGGVLVGNKGSALRLDYGLVGDTVNEAARVESLTKFYGVRLLVTRETFAQFSTQTTRRLVDRVIVKGKTEPVEMFECENPCTPANYAGLCGRYQAAYDRYLLGKFAEAKTEFEKMAQEFSDGPSKTLAARCAELAAQPPANWDGIWRMETK